MKRIIRDTGADKEHTVVFDASDPKTFRFESAIMECDTFSLFEGSDRKAVIIREPYFLNAGFKSSGRASRKKEEKEEADKEKRLSMLEQYLKQPNPDTALIFYCHGFDADSRKKEYKLLEKHGAVITNYKKMYDREFGIYADDELRKNGLQLTASAKRELLARADCDTLLLHRAIEKLVLYGEKKYDLEDIRSLVSLNPEVNVFAMSNLFIQGDMAGTIRAMDEMLKANIDHASMMTMLASRLRSLYCMKKLYESGMNQDMIAARTRQKPYAVKMGLQNTSGRSAKSLLNLLVQLAELDQGIKSGKILAKDGFEQFILKNGK